MREALQVLYFVALAALFGAGAAYILHMIWAPYVALPPM